MPIYEYQCQACNHKFEIIQKVSDDRLVVCPECQQDKLRKLVTAAAFRLKGTGWYATDFKDKKPPQQQGKSPEKTETTAKGDGTDIDKSSKDTNSNSSAGDKNKKASVTDSKASKSTKSTPD